MKTLLLAEHAGPAFPLLEEIKRAGWPMDIESQGKRALEKAKSGRYDLLVINMDACAGALDLLRRLRADHCHLPVVALAQTLTEEAHVSLLQNGADICLEAAEPAAVQRARVESLARRLRPAESAPTTLQVNEVRLDLLARQAVRGDKVLDLKPREFVLLEYFMRHAGKVISRSELLENVWSYNFDPQTNVVEVHISRLRAKLDRGYKMSLLRTVRALGYVFSDEDGTEAAGV